MSGKSSDWLPLADAEELVGRSRDAIYRWVREGKVRTIRPLRRRYFNRQDLINTERDTGGRGIR